MPTASESAIIRAALEGDIQNIGILVSRGPAIAELNQSGLLMLVAQRGHADAMRELIAAGLDPNFPSPETGWTPLMWAARHGQRTVVDLLLRHGASVGSNDSLGGWTALHDAADYGDPALIDALVSRGAAVDARTRYQSTPLMRAARHGRAKAVERLICLGADMNAIDQDGMSACRLARKYQHGEVLELLLRNGGSVQPRSVLDQLTESVQAKISDWIDRRIKVDHNRR